jgi:RNA polymerase sigma-70 factor (ECF subfamily)
MSLILDRRPARSTSRRARPRLEVLEDRTVPPLLLNTGPWYAFVRAFNEVRCELVSCLFCLLGNHEDAQDAAQDAFLKCWRGRDSLPEVRDMRAWIFRVGVNAAKDMRRNAWRRRARRITAELAQSTLSDDVAASALEDKEDLQRLREQIVHLRDEEKAVFLLRQNGDLTYEEIAQSLQSPVGSVKTLMRAAVQKLRQALTGK